MQKKKISGSPFVFSTNPQAFQEEVEEEIITLAPNEQRLMVKLNSKQRAGKVVTLVSGFKGQNKGLEALGKQLKTACGTGGSVKDGQILLQGDYKTKVTLLLQQLKYGISSK